MLITRPAVRVVANIPPVLVSIVTGSSGLMTQSKKSSDLSQIAVPVRSQSTTHQQQTVIHMMVCMSIVRIGSGSMKSLLINWQKQFSLVFPCLLLRRRLVRHPYRPLRPHLHRALRWRRIRSSELIKLTGGRLRMVTPGVEVPIAQVYFPSPEIRER